MPKTVVIVGTLDTKGDDLQLLRDLIQERGLQTLVVDFGVLGDPPFPPDISAQQVAQAGGEDLAALRVARDKTRAMRAMECGLTAIVRELFATGRLHGIVSMAGGGGTSIATAAMRQLPIGVPKLMVSSVVATGDVRQFVGTRDITLMPSVVDVAGVNSISRRIYANAAGAIAGMVEQVIPIDQSDRPIIVASMFGNTTPCVTRARELLEAAGYEVLVFHATGSGGRTMEALIEAGFVTACFDITTTELADEVCGGVMSAGPERLMAAGRAGIPTVIAPGCVDMVNFWARDTLPARYHDRHLYEWNPNTTLMRTNAEENRRIGEWIARAANAARGPVAVLLPLRGVSQLDSPGGAFWDPEADTACFDAIRSHLHPDIPLIEVNANINDPEFAERAATVLLEMMAIRRAGSPCDTTM
ncbi:MAG: Tm-1-like ATP-binding domain-containing protein [Anaerolineae bacterium]